MCNIDNLIINNQTNVPLEVLKALLSGGTKNEGTKQETRVSEQSGAASGLVHAHQPKGVSHFANQNWGAPPCFLDNKETISYSHSRLESHTRWNPHNTQTT